MGLKKFLFKKISKKFSDFSASINLKPTELDFRGKCLCLAPHPDDESIGMGGTLAKFADNFKVVLLTDGRKGIKGAENVVQIRQGEFKCALAAANIKDFEFLNIEDKKLLLAYEQFKTLCIEYDYIFVPNIIDQHPDHKAVSLLLRDLIKSGAKIKPGLKICMYEVWSTLGLVNAFVDISEYAEAKKNMINCYKSQIAQKDYEYHAMGLNQYRGMLKDKKFVEAFCVMSVDEFIKICEIY